MREHTTAPTRTVLWILVVATMIYVNAPLLVTTLASFGGDSYLQFPPESWSTRWYGELAGSSTWSAAILNSFLIGLGTAACSAALGTLAALGLQRLRRKLSEGLLALLLAPMIIPHVALAIGLYPMLARFDLSSTYAAVIAGHTVVAAPLVVIVVSAALQSVDPQLEKAAMSLGASPARAFREVTLPLISRAVIGGLLLSFTVSFDELELALFLSGPATRTFPLQIWEQVQFELTPLIAAASVVVVLAVLVVLSLLALSRRRRSPMRAAKKTDDNGIAEPPEGARV